MSALLTVPVEGSVATAAGPVETVQIPLTRDLVAIVDLADVELVGRFRWHAYVSGQHRYAARNLQRSGGGWTTQRMHILIMGSTGIDHRNGDGLDNRRENLRLATRTENMRNRLHRPGRSRFKGVCWRERRRGWEARINVDGRRISLGQFLDEEAAARIHFGEFAALNFPFEGERSCVDGGVR